MNENANNKKNQSFKPFIYGNSYLDPKMHATANNNTDPSKKNEQRIANARAALRNNLPSIESLRNTTLTPHTKSENTVVPVGFTESTQTAEETTQQTIHSFFAQLSSKQIRATKEAIATEQAAQAAQAARAEQAAKLKEQAAMAAMAQAAAAQAAAAQAAAAQAELEAKLKEQAAMAAMAQIAHEAKQETQAQQAQLLTYETAEPQRIEGRTYAQQDNTFEAIAPQNGAYAQQDNTFEAITPQNIERETYAQQDNTFEAITPQNIERETYAQQGNTFESAAPQNDTFAQQKNAYKTAAPQYDEGEAFAQQNSEEIAIKADIIRKEIREEKAKREKLKEEQRLAELQQANKRKQAAQALEKMQALRNQALNNQAEDTIQKGNRENSPHSGSEFHMPQKAHGMGLKTSISDRAHNVISLKHFSAIRAKILQQREQNSQSSESHLPRQAPKITARTVLRVTGIVAASLLVLIVSFGILDRWILNADAEDIQGSWHIDGKTNTVFISNNTLNLSNQVTFDYTIDPGAKVLYETLGTMEGTSQYRFSGDRQSLALFDSGTTDILSSLQKDLSWYLTCIGAQISGNAVPDLLNGEAGVILHKSTSSESNLNETNPEASVSDGDETSDLTNTFEEANTISETDKTNKTGEEDKSSKASLRTVSQTNSRTSNPARLSYVED